MNKLDKAIARLSPKEKARIKLILKKLLTKDFTGMDIKKLRGSSNIFRVRKGDLRIVYRIHEQEIFVLMIERRSEKTYRDF